MKKFFSLNIIFFSVVAIFFNACTRPPLPPPVVLFDQGHDQRFLIENTDELDLSELSQIFTEQGFEVKSSNQPFTAELLENVSTLIISGPFQNVTNDEINVLHKYLNDGGQMCIMLHIGFPVNDLLNSLGVATSNGVVREQLNLPDQTTPKDFYVTDLAKHPLTKDLEKIYFYGAWALNTQLEANIVAKTTSSAWVDLNRNKTLDQGDAMQPFSVIVTGQLGHGHFVVFSDDAIFQNRFLKYENKTLAINMAKWLKEGSYYK